MAVDWLSSGHSRYERFSQQTVLGISAGMLGEDSLFDANAPRNVSRAGTSRAPTAPVIASDDESDNSSEKSGGKSSSDASDTPDNSLPVGYTQEKRVTPSNRTYFVYFSPDGDRLESKVACWRHSLWTAPSPVADDVVNFVGDISRNSSPISTSALRSLPAPVAFWERPSSRHLPRSRNVE